MISGLELLTFEEKRKIVNLLVDRVVVAGDKVRIEGVLPPPGNPQSDLPEKSVIASKSSPYEGQNEANSGKLVGKENHLEGLSKAGLVVLDLVLGFAVFGLAVLSSKDKQVL